MDKETLSNYGWIVICVLVLAVMIALAGPFGNFIADAVKSTTQGLFDVNQGALDAAGIVIDDNGFADGENGGAGSNGTSVDHNGPTIPEGAYYGNLDMSTGNITWYTEMPANVSEYDFYLYGDYLHLYSETLFNGWFVDLALNDIGIPCPSGFEYTDETKTTYGAILASINGAPVTTLSGTFAMCFNLVDAPRIPSSITTIGDRTFFICNSLTSITIPDSVTSIGPAAFEACTSLESITFEGTVAQWNAISFSDNWNYDVPATYVQCSDGQVSLS